MTTQKDIVDELQQVTSLKNLTEVYGEIASIRMKKIRDFVLKNREFLASIEDIFKECLKSYAFKLSLLIKSGKIKKGQKVTFLAHNGKIVAVLISANTGFYGEVVQNTFNKFLADTANLDVETTIIGKVGRSLFVSAKPDRPYTYFELPDYGIESGKLAEVIGHLVPYEEIRVYYGQYKTVISQKPNVLVISSGTTVKEVPEPLDYDYIFEPSVEKILQYFEAEIFASLFDQSVRESQLAKFASRILAMDSAVQNIDKRLAELSLDKMKIIHREIGRKQINTVSGLVSSDIF